MENERHGKDWYIFPQQHTCVNTQPRWQVGDSSPAIPTASSIRTTSKSINDQCKQGLPKTDLRSGFKLIWSKCTKSTSHLTCVPRTLYVALIKQGTAIMEYRQVQLCLQELPACLLTWIEEG